MISELFLKGSAWQLCEELIVGPGEESEDLLGGWRFQGEIAMALIGVVPGEVLLRVVTHGAYFVERVYRTQ